MIMKTNILPTILISGIILLGSFTLMNNPLAKAQTCSDHCQGFVQGCEDGEEDNNIDARFHYHFDPNTVSQSYYSGYNSGYYFGYYGPYDYCEATDDHGIGCKLTHWDIMTQKPC